MMDVNLSSKPHRSALSAAIFARSVFNGAAVDGLRRAASGVLLLCLVALAPGAAAFAQADQPLGQVVKQQGAVTALRGTAARALHLGAPVFIGDRIVTRAQAKVEIGFRDGSTLSVGPDTDVEVVDYSPEVRRSGSLSLLLGIIRTSLSDLWNGGFEVRTRAAVASVRSTDWITEFDNNRASVFVVSGEVGVTGTAGATTVRLSKGDGTDVDIGAAPSAPKQWGAARVQDVLARTRVP